ncbi:PAS domain S-box protein [Polluticoccus soli]|uniref:PAS domain S-box protein n=1 Tax=Polluticoccus soli TaxID=3034150 RepID=UPI0023E129D2|nr:PAS domain S-box protein [Flavipsychrobacter sp. JY13-12]
MKTIAVIEDDNDAWLLLKNLLIKAGYESKQLIRFASIADIRPQQTTPEVVLTDLGLPDSKGLATFKKVCSLFPDSPIIVITGDGDADLAIDLIREGAQDYLVKGEIDHRLLSKSIQHSIERKRITSDYKRIFFDSPTPKYILDAETLNILAVNKAVIEKYGYSEAELLHMHGNDLRPAEEIQRFRQKAQTLNTERYDGGIWWHLKKDGTVFAVHIYVHTTEFDGRRAFMVVAIDIDKQLKAEQALEEKALENEQILESMTDAFFKVDENHCFTYVNQEFEKILQKKRGEILGQNIWEVFPEAMRLKFYEGYQRALQTRENTYFEEKLPGYGLWLSVKAYPFDKGMAVYFIDITEQKLAQEKLARDEQNLRAIINNTSDIIWSVDRQNNIISANDAFWTYLYALTGKKQGEITEADFNNEVFAAWTQFFDRAFRGETFKTIWTSVIGNEEYTSETSFNPIRNEQGDITGASCFSRDITQERKLQQKILTDDANLKAMIDNTDDLIWSVDTDFNLISANKAFLTVIETWIDRSLKVGDNIFDPKMNDALTEKWKGLYSKALNGEQFLMEQEANDNGSTLFTETRFNPIRDTNGKIIGVSCFSHDVTPLRTYLQKTEEQNKQLREIAWIQSHKVRNHVASILGLIQVIDLHKADDETSHYALRGIKQSSEELDVIIREINEKTQQLDQNEKSSYERL